MTMIAAATLTAEPVSYTHLDVYKRQVVIASLRLDDVEIVLAPAGVNVGIAGILFLLPFVMGFQRS